MASKTMSKGMSYSGSPDVQYGYKTAGQMLLRDEFVQIVGQRDALRLEIAEINRKINTDKPFRQTFNTKKEWQSWVDTATERKNVLLIQYQQLCDILTASESAKKVIIQQRSEKLGGMSIVKLLKKTIGLIKEMCEEQGMISHRCRNILTELTVMSSVESPLLDLLPRGEVEDEIAGLKKQHATDVARERAASQQAVGILRSQLRDIQERRGRAASVLERLYNERYEEVDDFRKARGVTHRIHLTADDCEAIEDAIKG